MRSRTRLIGTVIVLSGVWNVGTSAQQPASTEPQPQANRVSNEPGRDAGLPLKIQIVVSQFRGEKKVSSLPYTLALTASGSKVNLRTGGQLPVASSVGPNGPMTYNYQSVGMSIDCAAWTLDGGRVLINITLEDSSVYPEDKDAPLPKTASLPSLSTFRANESVILKDGQSSEYTAAADKVTGLVTKVVLTLTVLK